MRRFLFMSGEFECTMLAVFRRDLWEHTMTSKRLCVDSEDCVLHRTGIVEDLLGVVYFHDSSNKEIAESNLKLIVEKGVPCWPDPRRLLKMSDRREVLSTCVDDGLVSHSVQFVLPGEMIHVPFPFVLKVGNEHRGNGKFLVEKRSDIPEWDGLATVEPFFYGRSFRVLNVGERSWGVWYENQSSWIKNSPGCSIWSFEFTDRHYLSRVLRHARKASKLFGLEISGVDYIIDKHCNWHFLEINQFPGLNVSDDQVSWTREYLDKKMEFVEKRAKLDS